VNFLSLDLSLTSTGYCNNGISECISFHATGPERLRLFREAIKDLILKFGTLDGVIIEGYSFASRNSQAHSIGELGGVIRLLVWELGIPYVVVPPTSRAKFATGKGNASKNEVISSVSARTGIIWSNPGADDKCDAWILEEMAMAKYGLSQVAWSAVSMQALDKVDWSSIDSAIEKNK
jgi:Holliday junction resolvasome RuvABC endonuclease subunit